MSVALSNGASVVAFIGLSINTLRGLHYLYDLLESLRDAPQDLQCIYFQLRFFQLSFSTFQHSLEEGVKLGIVTPIDGQTRLAIDDAQNTIKQLQEVIDRYGEGRATRFGTRVRVAMRKNQLGSLSRRLEKTSEQIHATHCGITMLAQSYHHQVCAANSSNLDKQLLMLHDTVSKNKTGDITEKLDAINQAVTDSAESIMNLMVDISRRNDPHLVTSPRSCTSRRTSSSPFPVNSKQNRNLHQMLEDELVTQLTTHLSVPIRNAVRDALLDDPLLGDRTLNQPELDILSRVFDTCDLKSCEASSGHTQNWRTLSRVCDLVSTIVGESQNFPVTTNNLVTMFKPGLPRGGQLFTQLLTHPCLCWMKPYLTPLLKLICLLESIILVSSQYSINGRTNFIPASYDSFSYFFVTVDEPSIWSLESPSMSQGVWITNGGSHSVSDQCINCFAEYLRFENGGAGNLDWACTNVTSMSFSPYIAVVPNHITEVVRDFDCIFIPNIRPKERFTTIGGSVSNYEEIIPISNDLSSMLLPTISLFIVTISWVARHPFLKDFATFFKFFTAANAVRILAQLDSNTMWYLAHPDLWFCWHRSQQLMVLKSLVFLGRITSMQMQMYLRLIELRAAAFEMG